jgi:glucokinase
MAMILSGDIGGTSTRLAFFDESDSGLRALTTQVYRTKQHRSLSALLETFLRTSTPASATHACFGVAGPVRNGRCDATNLPWVVDAQRLATELRLPSVGLINDVEANAWGIETLGPEDFCVLNPGVAVRGSNAALLSAGTGLGEAALYWNGRRHRPVGSEGGHVDFAPRNELEIDLLRYLIARFGRVSYERVLSGPGLVNVYGFLRDRSPASEPKWLEEELATADAAAVISKNALEGRNRLCTQALDLFVSVLGAAAGNLALKMLAMAGIYLGGGIAPKILPRLRDRTFLDAFVDKGRMRGLVERVPVSVILNEHTALVGAARWAALARRAERSFSSEVTPP